MFQTEAIDLDKRDAVIIGRVDPESEFLEDIVYNVMALMAYPEDDEESSD